MGGYVWGKRERADGCGQGMKGCRVYATEGRGSRREWNGEREREGEGETREKEAGNEDKTLAGKDCSLAGSDSIAKDRARMR